MPTPILATKLYIPPPRPKAVLRPRLVERLNAGLHGKLTLISAGAGFGKTTLVSEWIQTFRAEVKGTEKQAATSAPPLAIAWLSLDQGDNDPVRFLTYFVAALQTVAPQIGAGVLAVLQSPQPPREPAGREAMLTALLNEMTTIPTDFVLVLDDYHVIDAREPLGAIDQALTFLLEHLPPQMHMVIATREDPNLPLARWRARGQLTELRVTDLRFTHTEAAEFLNQVMALKLSTAEIAALETRTEGWIVGLQLAAISIQGQPDTGSFIQSFTGNHRFVLDYLVEEVLHQQPANIQNFLLRTSILDRLCGSLCDAVLGDALNNSPGSGQAILETIENANLFIVPLDNQRRWYRYHHLFAELLRQRLHQSMAASTGSSSVAHEGSSVADYHIRASAWYEANGLEIEAFHHATAANDIDRAERLIEGDGIPRHFRGAVLMILDWLASLPLSVLNARPSLWWKYASLLLVNGQTTGVEEKLQATEAALHGTASSGESLDSLDDKRRNLVGQIAAARATLALTRYQPATIIVQAHRALTYLHQDNLSFRSTANWTLGFAYYLQGDRAAAGRAYTEAIALSQAVGDIFTTILATIGLGNVQEVENQLHLAAQTFQHVLQLAGEQPLQIIHDAQLGLARILYEWNDLAAAEQYGWQSLHLARQYDKVIDRFILCEIVLARVKLAQGDLVGATAMLAQTEQSARQQNFAHRLPEIAAVQVLVLLRQGKVTAAAQLAQTHQLPISQARVHLAQGDGAAALALLEPVRQQMEAKHWQDERLKVTVLQAVAWQIHGAQDKALHLLTDALTLAQPEGFIRIFVDEGLPMAQLLSAAAARGIMPEYTGKLLADLAAEGTRADKADLPPASPLIEPLSQRELEVLGLIAQGLSNQAICARLSLALDTVKGHNRRIYDKLQVQRRTEAVAKARSLNLLPSQP